MGLFSKKTYICEKCGKEYESRLGKGGGLCDECFDMKIKLEEKVGGYNDYLWDLSTKRYSLDDYEKIQKHQDALFEKFRITNGISESELRELADMRRKLTDEQLADAVDRIINSSLNTFKGATCKGEFFLPSEYDGVIVDSEDIFAVGFTTAYSLGFDENVDNVLCVIFTNDPYVPVFTLVYEVQKGFFDTTKSKMGRKGVAAFFRIICPNLTYEVQDLKGLKKAFNSEESIKGNITKEEMKKYMKNAKLGMGIFDENKLTKYLNYTSSEMIHDCGYIEDYRIDDILEMDKGSNKRFWDKQFERFA